MLSKLSYRFACRLLLLSAVITLLNACKPVSQELVGVPEGKKAEGSKIPMPCQLAEIGRASCRERVLMPV